MHGTCSNRSMLITTCTTLKAHLQTLYKIQLQPGKSTPNGITALWEGDWGNKCMYFM